MVLREARRKEDGLSKVQFWAGSSHVTGPTRSSRVVDVLLFDPVCPLAVVNSVAIADDVCAEIWEWVKGLHPFPYFITNAITERILSTSTIHMVARILGLIRNSSDIQAASTIFSDMLLELKGLVDWDGVGVDECQELSRILENSAESIKEYTLKFVKDVDDSTSAPSLVFTEAETGFTSDVLTGFRGVATDFFLKKADDLCRRPKHDLFVNSTIIPSQVLGGVINLLMLRVYMGVLSSLDTLDIDNFFWH
ncbi:hypothetical protein SELMODRAFT_414351 [Selaginella moellendorffii]|uniref:Uncharacterized protein n=1 Tax=Selaginella moellendorffii TaxID=88036 RepID=D8RSG3_SELML|nr:hypothetical protein SELMODRAFT_414351 [Selaginella moellendorffii]